MHVYIIHLYYTCSSRHSWCTTYMVYVKLHLFANARNGCNTFAHMSNFNRLCYLLSVSNIIECSGRALHLKLNRSHTLLYR